MNYALDDHTLFVCVPGDLLSTSVDALREQLSGLMESPDSLSPDIQTVQLDLRSAKIIDSAGVNLLVGVIRACQARQLRLRVLISSRVVQRTLLFTRLDKHLDIALEVPPGPNRNAHS